MKTEKSDQVVFLRGKKTILRPMDETDLPKLTKWVNDPDVTNYLDTFLPKGMAEERDWIAKLKDKKEDIVFAICLLDGTFIGCMGIHQIKWKDRVATTGAFIGEKKYWNLGFGTDAKMQVLNYIFNTLNLHKVLSNVFEYNGRSLAYSKHCGYVVEGRRRKHVFRNGEYHDLIELGLFKEEWLPYWKKYLKGKKL